MKIFSCKNPESFHKKGIDILTLSRYYNSVKREVSSMTYKFEDHEAQTIIIVTMDGSYEEVLDYLCNKYGTEYVMENMEDITHWLDNVAEK